MIDAARPVRHAAGGRCFVDGTYVKVAGGLALPLPCDRPAWPGHRGVRVTASGHPGLRAGFFTVALTVHGDPSEVITDRAPALATVIEELVPTGLRNTGQYENNRVECDHGRLKATLGPVRGMKTNGTASVAIRGHAVIQNLRRGHDELAVDDGPLLRLATAFDERRPAI